MELVEQKKDQLDSMLRLQNYQLECAEIKSQIQEKRKAIDATQYMGSDLGGVMALQRRLSTMEGALSVLEPKLLHLQVLVSLQCLKRCHCHCGAEPVTTLRSRPHAGGGGASGHGPFESSHGRPGAV